MRRGGKTVELFTEVTTTEFADEEGDIVYVNDRVDYTKSFEKADTLSVKLGGALPLMGKPATKLGYKLPRPVGINALLHLQEQNLQFTGLSIGLNGGDLIDLSDLFLLDESSLAQTTTSYMAKGDVWLLPFLNLTLVAGRAENKVDGNLVLTDEIKALLGLLGLDVPDAINIVTDVSANLYGGGLVLAGGIGDFNITGNYQLIFADAFAVNTVTTVSDCHYTGWVYASLWNEYHGRNNGSVL